LNCRYGARLTTGPNAQSQPDGNPDAADRLRKAEATRRSRSYLDKVYSFRNTSVICSAALAESITISLHVVKLWIPFDYVAGGKGGQVAKLTKF
jgi:hypothetical protein